MSRMSDSTGHNRSIVTRPDSSKLAELHVYVIPPDIYREKFNNVLNSTLDDTISVGFIRVAADTMLYVLREEIDHQIGVDIIPRDYVFLKGVGRSLTRVKPKQEYQLKAKNFCPPLAFVPEIYLLEVSADMRAFLSLHSHSPSLNSLAVNSVLAEDSPRNPAIRTRFPPLNNSYEQYSYDEYDPEDPRHRNKRPPPHTGEYGNDGQKSTEDRLAYAEAHRNTDGIDATELPPVTQTFLTSADVLDRRKSKQENSAENAGKHDQSEPGDNKDTAENNEGDKLGQYENERLKGPHDDSGEQHDEILADDSELLHASNQDDNFQQPDAVTNGEDRLNNGDPQADITPLSGNIKQIGSRESEKTSQGDQLDSDEESDRLSPTPYLRGKLTEEEKRKIQEEKEALNAELNVAKEERRRAERRREEMVKRAKTMQTKTQNRRNHTRDIWKKRYFEEKKHTAPLEDQTNRFRLEIDQLHRKLMGVLEAPRDHKSKVKHEEPSERSNMKIQATKLHHVNGDLQRRIDTLKMKLTAEMKLRNQAESELRSLRSDLTQRKINLTLTRSQQMASLSTSQDNLSFLAQPHVPSPRFQHLIG